MAQKNPRHGHTARLQPRNIVLPKFLKHRRAHLTRILRRKQNGNRKGGKNHAVKGNFPARNREQSEFQAENVKQNESHPETRHGHSEEGKEPDDLIRQTIAVERRYNTSWNRNDQHHNDRCARQQKGSRQILQQLLLNRNLSRIGHSHIAMHHTVQPSNILLMERQV